MEKRIYLLAVMLLVVGGCGGEKIPEPPPPTDGANVTAGAANVVRPAASVSVPVDVGGALIDQETDPVLPIAGPDGEVVEHEKGNLPTHGPDAPQMEDLSSYGPDGPPPGIVIEPRDESLDHGPEGPGIKREPRPSGVVLPGGL